MAQKKEEELRPSDQPSLHTEMVKITDKNTKHVSKVTKVSYERVWKDRGWTVVDDKKSKDHSTTQPNLQVAVIEEEQK